MSEYRIGFAAELLGVSPDTVRRLADNDELVTTRCPPGVRVVDGASLAKFLADHAHAADAGVVVGRSARNRFTGIVTRVVKDRVASQVEMQAGPHRIVSLMTTEAVDELGLEPGVLAVAVVKATNVVIEITDVH